MNEQAAPSVDGEAPVAAPQADTRPKASKKKASKKKAARRAARKVGPAKSEALSPLSEGRSITTGMRGGAEKGLAAQSDAAMETLSDVLHVPGAVLREKLEELVLSRLADAAIAAAGPVHVSVAPKAGPKPKARKARPPLPTSGLGIVKSKNTLFWPMPGQPFRCPGGGVVQLDDPFLSLDGYNDQRYKIRAITEDEQACGFVRLADGNDYPTVLTPCNNMEMAKQYKERGIAVAFEHPGRASKVEVTTPTQHTAIEAMHAEGFEVPAVDIPSTEG